MNRLTVTHPAVLQTARWPAPRCPVCCGGGGSASWSCSMAWTGTEGSAPTHRTPPGPQLATVRRTRPAETHTASERACRSGEILQSQQRCRCSGEVHGELNPNRKVIFLLLLLSDLRAVLEGRRSWFLIQTFTSSSSSIPPSRLKPPLLLSSPLPSFFPLSLLLSCSPY